MPSFRPTDIKMTQLAAWTLSPTPLPKFRPSNRSSTFKPTNTTCSIRPSTNFTTVHPLNFIQTKTHPTKQQSEPPTQNHQGFHLGFTSITPIDAPISLLLLGSLPSYLHNVAFYQNGPGLFSTPHKDGLPYTPTHWFDALAVAQAFFLDARSNTVTYRNRVISHSLARAVRSVSKHTFSAFSLGACHTNPTFWHYLRNFLTPSTRDPLTNQLPTNLNVSFQSLPGKGPLNAMSDCNSLQRLDPTTLEVIEEYDYSHFHPEYKQVLTSSHGVSDQESGEFFNYSQTVGLSNVEYKVFRIAADGNTVVLARFKDVPCYIHSFSLTQNFLVLILCPCHINIPKLVISKQVLNAFQFDSESPAKFVVIDRKNGDVVAKYQHEAFFFLHALNAFESDGNIHIDLCYYKNDSVLDQLHIANMKANGPISWGRLHRFTLPNLSSAIHDGPNKIRRATSTKLSDVPIELAQVSSRKMTRPHRFVYGISNKNETQLFGNIVKVDLESGETISWSLEGAYTGEPVFVADPEGVDEDDGCLLLVVLEGRRRRSCMVCLDAKTMTEVARAPMPISVPFGFHGHVCKYV